MVVAGLVSAYALYGCLAAGRALLEEAISESIRTGTLGNRSRWVVWVSEVRWLAGHGDEAWQHMRQGLDLVRQKKAHGDEAHTLYQLGAVQTYVEPPDAA